MGTLEISQTVFYMVSSLAILALAGLLAIFLFRLAQIMRDLRIFSKDFRATYEAVKLLLKKFVRSSSGGLARRSSQNEGRDESEKKEKRP